MVQAAEKGVEKINTSRHSETYWMQFLLVNNTPPMTQVNPQCTTMADQQDQKKAQEAASNPIDRIFNKECTMCKAHTIMINRFVKQFNELKEDYQADSRSKRKKLEKKKSKL